MISYRAAARMVETIETSGLWLGFNYDLRTVCLDSEFFMHTGDVLLLYTDGITESRNDAGGLYENRLSAALCRYGDGPLAAIRDGILQDRAGFKSDDDVTMLIIKKI